ncbi:GNAT family N-acetyltransferase [Kitasatospora sp. NPDC048365]|uniref:GNAT family N-acetyltransferase n=1 Tax=Kitasatospora sp. NPDC048365 TaxID=3364050 RepID=UPI00371B7101
MVIMYEWRDGFTDGELGELHAAGFGYRPTAHGWGEQVRRHSLGWVCAREASGRLIGFVNVAWDGGRHAFLLDTVVAPDAQRGGIGSRLVAEAAREARAAGCEWLHVDFEPELSAFYLVECGFRTTAAGLLCLTD